jgi:hypothetical protein
MLNGVDGVTVASQPWVSFAYDNLYDYFLGGVISWFHCRRMVVRTSTRFRLLGSNKQLPSPRVFKGIFDEISA